MTTQTAEATTLVQPVYFSELRTLPGGEDRYARALLIPGEAIAAHGDGTYTIASQYDVGVTYLVDLAHHSCNCPDHVFGAPQGWCKHLMRACMKEMWVGNKGYLIDWKPYSYNQDATCGWHTWGTIFRHIDDSLADPNCPVCGKEGMPD